MDKQTAWLLGYLLSDGCINVPTYRYKGDETHLEFICKYDDREVLYKVKNILNTRARICDYPNYKSPQSKIRIYDKKEFINKYKHIKTSIPQDIEGYERHFIRGLTDGDGCLYYRASRDSFVYQYINEYKHIVEWVVNTICNELDIPKKDIRYIEKDHIYGISWEGNIARLIVNWLYYGDIDDCCLKRKKDKYLNYVMNGKLFESYDASVIYAAKAYIDTSGEIAFFTPGNQTLIWCKRLQKILSFNTVPVFHNKGRRKYYHLYIPNICHIANTRDILSLIA